MKNLNYFNLNQIKSNPDGQTTVKRQSRVMSQSGCSAVDVPMTSYGAPDEHPMSTRSASDGTRWNSRGWKYVAMIFAVLVMSIANIGMAWGVNYKPYLAEGFEGSTTLTGSSCTANNTTATANATSRTGSKVCYAYPSSASSSARYVGVGSNKTADQNWYIHAIVWVKGDNVASGKVQHQIGPYGTSPATAYVNTTTSYTRCTITPLKSGGSAKQIRLYFISNNSTPVAHFWYDDFIMYLSSENVATDLTKPSQATNASATTSSITWSEGSDTGTGATGVQATYIWHRTTGSGENGLTLNDQGIYSPTTTKLGPINDQSGEWTLIDSIAGGTLTASGTYIAGHNYAIVHRDLAYNYSTPTYVTVPAAAGSTWYVKGSFDSWGDGFNFTGSGTELTATVNITTAGLYEFKINNSDGNAWYGNTGNIGCNVSGWTFSTDESDNCKFFASETGNYTFTFNTSTKKLSVTYPTAQGKYYYKNTGSWGAVYVYRFKGGINNGWPGTQVVETETICGDTYYFTYADPGTTLIFDCGSNSCQTGNETASGNAGKYVQGTDGNDGWRTFTTYTISYAANGGGSSMTSETGICPNGSLTLTSNAFTAPSGCASFSHWTANVAVTANGNEVAAGGAIADGATLSNINSNIALTAVWKLSAPTITKTPLYNTFTVSGSMAGSSYKYSTDGTTPTTAYSSAVAFDADITAKAIATKSGYADSDVASLECSYINCSISSCGNATLTYTINGSTSVNNTAANLLSEDPDVSNPTALETPAAASAVTLSTMEFDGNAGKAVAKANGCYTTSLIMSSKLSVYNGSAFNTSHYLQFAFTVKEGYTFTPCDIQFVVQPTSYATDFRWEITDGSETYGYGTASGVGIGNDAGATVLTGITSPSAMGAGTYYIRLYSKFKKDGKTNDFRIGDEVILKGTTAAAACTAPTTVNVTATVNEVSGYWFYPGDDVVLTAAPTGSPAGSPVTYQWKKNGADIDGATSSTYTINDAAASDAGKYTCTISYGACSTTSAEFSLKCMQFYLKNSSGGDISNHALTKVDATHATLSLSLTGGTTYKFRVTDGCNDWYGNSDATGMTSSNCTNWTMPHDADCKVTTNSKTGTYTFNFDFTGGVLGSEMKVSIVYPGGDQAAGKIIYWDNSVLNWDAGDQWYRIGKNGHNNKTQMTLVPGTANLYKVTTTAYDGFEYWHIANNDGNGTGNIFWTKGDEEHAITHAMAFEAAPVTADAVTVTPGTDHSTGTSSDNDNCAFYSKTITNGMKTDRVTISDYSNGTITVNYTNTSNVASTLTSAYADLAHTVILTSITATPNTGYDAGAITINGGAYSANYVVTGATTIAATFSPQVYSITYKDQGNVAFSGSHASGYPTTHTYGSSTVLKGATKAGYNFGGWYGNPECTGAAMTSIGATSIKAGIILYAKWTVKQYSVSHSLSNVTKTSGATGANAATYGTDYTAVFAAAGGSALPSTIAVTIGGDDATSGTEYTWDQASGTVTINGSYILGDIVITVSGVSDCPSSASGETVYKFVTKSSDLGTDNVCAAASTEYPQTTSNSLSTLTGGTLKAYGTGSLGQLTFNEDCYKLAGSDNTWLIVELDCAIATGDVIRYVNYASSGNTVMIETTRGTSTSILMDGNGTMMEQTIVAPAALNGVKTLYLTRKAGTAFLTSFEILRPYTVTLNASTNGGKVDGKNTATMYFKDSESQALPHAFKSSNYFTGWFEDDDSGDAVDNPYTATGTGTLYAQFDACASQTGSLYKFAVKNTLTAGSPFTTGTDGNASMTVGNYLSSLYGGTLDVHGRKTYLTNTTSAFTLANNSAYLLVTLDCPLQAGDQIKSIVSSNSVAITTSSSRSTTNTLATGTNTITIPAGFAGATTLYIWRNSSNGDISYLEIIRPNGVTITGAVSPDGYGTVSPASIFVASGSTVSLASNVLTCDGKTLTATPTAATAEYTYAFSSWSGVTNGGTVSVATTATANFTRTANNYTLTWNTNGGSDLDCDGCTSGSTAYGTAITAPNDPTLSNYTFDGWKTNNDGTGTTAGSTMPAANTTYYAAWKQTVTLTTGAQGSGDNQTPYVYKNGTGVTSFTAHTASGYTLQGYYTAGSGGTKVLNADGSFASANVDGYITSGKWSRTGAAPTLYAQWLASEDCSTSDFVIKKGSSKEFEGCMESSSYDGTATSFTAGSPTTVGKAKMTISNYSDGGIKRPGSGNTFSIVIEPVSGYYLKSVCWAGKVEDDETVSYYWDDNSSSAITISPTTTSGTGVTYNAPSSTTKFTASYTDDGDGSGGIWWRNVQVEVCAGGGTTYSVTYDDNDATGGTAPTDTDSPYDYGTTVTVLGNTGELAKTNYTFAGWTTNNDGTGSSYVADNTFSITGNTTLYAKWTQAVTFDANTSNHGSTGGSATAVWNATGLTGITHATPASGYKLLGYYTAPTSGTKVLNSDGSFASTAVTDYITSGKWSRTGTAPTLYAQYESAGALTWNLIVNSDTTNLSTSTKTSAFTEISTTNMTDAALTGLTYSKDKKSSLTGKISTPAKDAGKYVYVTFVVADGYKFTPSNISVKVQPVGDGEHKAVELSLTDGNHSLVSGSATKCDGTSSGKTTTVSLAGDETYFTGTVTLKIYVYPHGDATASTNNCYRLGTPITIEGEIEEACATMPSYTSMSYTTTTFAPGAGASGSPITIVGGTNIDTYQWKYNRVNDRTSGTNCGTGTSLTPLTDAGATADGTRYYWCEMTNGTCGITIKSPAVAITVAAAKSDATVTWTGPASTPNYGGGGYTIKATVNETEWNGNAADLVITAPAGIRIYNVSSGTDGSSRKYVQADFDVQTSFDRSTYASNIPFTVSAAATATYNAISNDHNTAYSACAGAGEGSSYNIRMRKTVTKDGNYYHCANTDGWISPNISSSYSTGKAGTKMETDFDTVASSNTQYVWVRTYHANVNKVRIYADFRANDMTVSNVYKHTDYFTANNKYLVDYTAVYNDDEENENTGTAAQGYVDITLDEVMAANDILLVKFNDSKVRPLGAVITEGSAGSLNTHLQWSGSLANGATVNKKTTDAYFTYSASMITENTNSLGAITYSSSDPSVATVDATGKVALIAAGSTTIKATLAASGCYKKAEISYTLNVTEEACAIAAGTLTLTSGTESKCSSDEVTLTLTGFESGASIQWKDGDTDINNGGNYTIAKDGTTSTLTTNQPGTYSVIVTKGCFVRSNRITISNKSTSVHVTRLVKEWYIKNGRLTPDIALWELGDDCSFVSVAASSGWDAGTGLTEAELGEKVFYEKDGIVYLKGTEPDANAGAVQNYTLTLTVNDGCGNQTLTEEGKKITIHHQQNTDKHVLAFVVTGTEKGGFTAGVPSTQTTGVDLYNTIATNFDVLATNIYSTDDEQKLKEYYSQFDILCVTDYPNTQTKGVNKKSYVDALGSLIDIRPILTMEAFVSKLANWKAKGISGNPKSPTTRQYTMDLQCKDHEIFAGTKLTKVGEGDEAMYRVSMVDDTKEEYVSLDATYGGGAHAEKDGYNYGGKPALQGFEFTQEMSDNDLLPIGLIDDGARNPLQVGIERQHNMEARLMVLGINSYAMERLTDDGEKVVINALKYLMKKNAEDIADCSTSFVGGAEDHEKDWNYADNWTGNTVPLPTQKVRILADCEVSSTVYAQSVLIVTDGKYNKGSDVAKGKLTIKENGALIVGGKIQAASAPAYNRTRATTPDKLLIETSSTNQAALIFDNEEGETQATVNYHSKGYNDGSNYQFQYFAIPMDYVAINPVFANEANGNNKIYTYAWDEPSNGWERRGYYSEFYAFEGLAITTTYTTPISYTLTGNLASTAEREMTLTHSGEGSRDNIIGNSWMAPINIASLVDAFATDESVEKTVYIYCAGNDSVDGDDGEDYGNTEVAGQWLSIPMGLTTFPKWDGLKVIPAMQAYLIKVTGETTLTLNYDQMVRSTAPTALNQKLRAPKRRTALNEDKTLTRLRVADSRTHTDLYLVEGGIFSDAFDNGWEATYMPNEGASPQFYAMGVKGKMAVLATNELDGTEVGFEPGKETAYTISFKGAGNGYYLNDVKKQISTLITDGGTYSFTYEAGDDANRFYISSTPFSMPQITTGMENLDAVAPKVQKVIYNDKMYIIRGGKVFSADGQLVK